MKKILSLVLVLALVLTSFSFAAADPVTVGQDLKALGVLTGDENGNLNPDQQLTREQAIVVLVRMMGKEADAKATTTASSFKDIKGTFYGPYIAYAELQGWTTGKSAGVFGFGQTATIDEIYAFMLRALGYTVATLPEAVTKAAELKLNTDVTAEAGKPVLRGQVFITMNNTLNTNPKDGKTALVYVLKLKPEPVVPVVEFAVADLTALNTKQIEVKFSAEVDKVTAETASNYTVGGVAFGKAVLQADKKTVIATMATDTKVTNATEVEYKVLKNVKDAKGVALKADFAKKITVVDTVSPTLTKVEAVGAKTLKLTFSEPIWNGTNATIGNTIITVKSGIYTYAQSASTADYNDRTVTITLGTNLIEGPVVVKVNAAGMSDAGAIRDFAGLVIVPAEQTLTYAKDTTVATATIESINKATGVAKVKFSKPVFGANVKLFHSVNGVAAYGTNAVTVTEPNATTDWEFTFTNAVPAGALSIFLANDSVAANQISDLFGVKVPNNTYSYTVVADTTAPTVSKLTVNTNASIDVLFSEDVDATEKAKAENFEIVKPDGTKLAFTIGVPGADVSKTVRLVATLTDNTTYTVNVKAMKDVAGNAMAAAYSAQAAVGDNVHPSVASAYITANNTLYITFSEDMANADIANKANYLIDTANNEGGDDATGAVALGANDSVTVITPKKVKITWAAADLAAGDDVRIGAVKDLAGKTLTSATSFSTDKNITADTLTYTAQLVAINKVKLVFNKELSLFDNTEFTVAGANILSIESNTVVNGVTEVVLVLDANLAYNGTPNVTAADAGPVGVNTKSTEGTAVTLGAVAATDKVAPIVDKVVFISATQLQVIFKEAVASNLFAGAGANGFSVTGGTLTSALPFGADQNTVVLTGTDFTINTDVAYNGTNGIKDMNANTLAAFTRTDALTQAAVTLGYAAGTVTLTPNYTMTAGTAGAADVIAVFAEPAANVGNMKVWVKTNPTFQGTTALTVTRTAATTYTVVATTNATATVNFTLVFKNADGISAEIGLTVTNGGTVITAQ